MTEAAKEARERAFAPYSSFKVGAAVLGGSGRVYTGCNIENASFGLTVCAERVAIFNAISSGESEILAVVIVAGEHTIPRPCGACLQVMREFSVSGESLIIKVCALDGSCDTYSLKDYLPMPFDLNEHRGEQ